MSSVNYYDVLEVGRDASESEIKKSYRALSLKWHPDRNSSPDAKSKFQAISEAYDTLSDAGKRKEHDDELNGVHRNPFSMGGGSDENMDDIGNIFNMMFGGGMPGMPGMQGVRISGMPGGIHVFHNGGMPGMPGMNIFHQLQKPPPIIKNIQIGFAQAYTGCTIHLQLEKWTIRNQLRVSEIDTVYVPIPPGIDEGEIIVMRDCGNAASDELKGDVKLIVSIENNTPFLRQGMDLVYKKTITLKEALTGFAFEVQHINGKNLCLNNHTNRTIIKPGFKKPIPGLGMNRDNNTGNLIIEFSVDFPEHLTEEQTVTIGQIL